VTRARIALTLWLTLGAWMLFIPPASAYLDPGSTSVIFGALVAGAMGLGMFFKTFWRKLTGLFRRDDDQVDADRS
jgi:hypothetical protein